MTTDTKEPKLALSAEEAFAVLGISRPHGFRMLREGRIPGAFRLGKRWIISRARLEEFLKNPESN